MGHPHDAAGGGTINQLNLRIIGKRKIAADKEYEASSTTTVFTVQN